MYVFRCRAQDVRHPPRLDLSSCSPGTRRMFLGAHSTPFTRLKDTVSPISTAAVEQALRKGFAQPLMSRTSGAHTLSLTQNWNTSHSLGDMDKPCHMVGRKVNFHCTPLVTQTNLGLFIPRTNTVVGAISSADSRLGWIDPRNVVSAFTTPYSITLPDSLPLSDSTAPPNSASSRRQSGETVTSLALHAHKFVV
jgi:hypothetical protein